MVQAFFKAAICIFSDNLYFIHYSIYKYTDKSFLKWSITKNGDNLAICLMRHNPKKPYQIKMVQKFILSGKDINNKILLKFKYFYLYKISLCIEKISYSIIKVTFEEKIRKNIHFIAMSHHRIQ